MSFVMTGTGIWNVPKEYIMKRVTQNEFQGSMLMHDKKRTEAIAYFNPTNETPPNKLG